MKYSSQLIWALTGTKFINGFICKTFKEADLTQHFRMFAVSLKGQKLSIKVRRMKYEIPREAFKQRLENRLNFVFVDLQAGTSPVNFENVEKLSYGPQFKEEFSAKFPEKTQNVILFNMSGDGAPAKAAQELADA